jgi:hypothetical protein
MGRETAGLTAAVDCVQARRTGSVASHRTPPTRREAIQLELTELEGDVERERKGRRGDHGRDEVVDQPTS